MLLQISTTLAKPSDYISKIKDLHFEYAPKYIGAVINIIIVFKYFN